MPSILKESLPKILLVAKYCVDNEIRDIVKLLEAGKPLPEKRSERGLTPFFKHYAIKGLR